MRLFRACDCYEFPCRHNPKISKKNEKKNEKKIKYKVVNFGEKFKIMKKGWFGQWKRLRIPHVTGLIDHDLTMDTEEEADELCKKLNDI